VRELENVIERALVLSQLPELGPEDLPARIVSERAPSPLPSNGGGMRSLAENKTLSDASTSSSSS